MAKGDKAPAATGGELTVKDEAQTTAVAVAGAAYDYGSDAGGGFEGTTQADLSIPFLNVLQANSPQVEDKQVEGASSGMIFNTVTNELVNGETGVPLLIAHEEHVFVEWTPRTKGGGFVGQHAVDSEVVKAAQQATGGDRTKKLQTPNGNDLIETYYLYSLILNAEGTEVEGFAVFPITSTKIKHYRAFKTAIYMIKGKPPLWAARLKISTWKDKNEKGAFYNVKFDPLVGGKWQTTLIDPRGP